MIRIASWILVCVVLCTGGLARADVVGPAKDGCPRGSTGTSCHGGGYCAPALCGNGICPEGHSCVELSLCVGVIGCAGLVAPGEDLSQYNRQDVIGECRDGECSEGGTCETMTVCAPPTGSGGGCGVLTAPGAPRTAVLLSVPIVAIALATTIAWRRRRRGG